MSIKMPRPDGSLIRKARKRRGLTQEELTREIDLIDNRKRSGSHGISVATIGRTERNETTPSDETLLLIAQALGVPPVVFYRKAELEAFRAGNE